MPLVKASKGQDSPSGISLPTEIRTSANDADYVFMIDASGAPYKITKANFLAGLSSGTTSGGTSGGTNLNSSLIFGSHFESLIDVKGHTIAGGAVISGDQKYFGSSSLYCDGSAASYATVSDPNSDFSIADSENFTFASFLHFIALPSAYGFAPFLQIGSNLGTNGFRVGWDNETGGLIQLFLGGTDFYFPWAPSINTWYYFSLERNNGSVICKIDGSQIGNSINKASAIVGGSNILIGGASAATSQRMRGYFDELIFSRSYLAITSKPTQAFS
ncbi:MAG: hypothetical protein PUP90_02435 [Nostoc sp. S4]|nr:hypothetical protein [Nostoc sp. S4]